MVAFSLKNAVCLLAALAAVFVESGVLRRRGTSGLPQAVRGGKYGRLLEQYNPTLHVENGCYPAAAIDEQGEVSGGLNNRGDTNGDCKKDEVAGTQVYARTMKHRGRRALMYSWYFYKDQPSPGIDLLGHTHDWEGVVIWLNVKTDAFIGMAVSAHGGYKKSKDKSNLTKGRPRVRYYSPNIFITHHCGFTDKVGDTEKL